MPIIQTESFRLAAYVQGDPAAPRVAIMLPGQLDSKDYVHLTSLVDALAKQGFLALSFDPPGTWESPGSIEEYTVTNYLQAVRELIRYFGNKPTVLAGHSRGGSVAMLAGTAIPEVSHIIPIFAYAGTPPPASEEILKQGFRHSFRDHPPGAAPTEEKREFKLPLSFFEDGAQYTALPGLSTCAKPKLFFYGSEDTIVEPEDVREGFAAAAEPKQIKEIQSPHDYRYFPEAITEINTAVCAFVA